MPSAVPSLARVLRAAAAHPGLACFDLGPDTTVVTWGAGPFVTEGPDWAERARRLLRVTRRGQLYSGGLVGWIGYEAGRFMERMPPVCGVRRLPDLRLWRTEGAAICRRGVWEITGDRGFRAQARRVLSAAAAPGPRREPLRPAAAPPAPPPDAAERYRAGVRAVLAAIRRGDVYQVNVAWSPPLCAVSDPLGCWLALREGNPAERGAFLWTGDMQVISNSPELFLSCEPSRDAAGDPAGGEVSVRSVPIKGTTPLSTGAAGAEALMTSRKERAELTMIVDLVRNDLSRVCRPGSVTVSPRSLRVCGDLLHAEQAVSASLRPGRDAIDALAASFPPGSVTGAPKVRAMELISDLEGETRGVYTGALGFFADDGGAHWNVAIRTATVLDGQARFHVGAGIVADSDPDREWAETLAKGDALARWLCAQP